MRSKTFDFVLSHVQMATQPEVAKKACTHCGKHLPLPNFYRSWNCCKECIKIRYRDREARRQEERDTRAAARLRSRSPHRDSSSAASSSGLDEADALYVMSNTLIPGVVKIGRASCPEAKAKMLAAGHPFRLQVEHAYVGMGFMERDVHKRISEASVQGAASRDWFYVQPRQANAIVLGAIEEARCGANIIRQHGVDKPPDLPKKNF